eukprot:365602-Chlamydomonas_euryale.AAC.6
MSPSLACICHVPSLLCQQGVPGPVLHRNRGPRGLVLCGGGVMIGGRPHGLALRGGGPCDRRRASDHLS